MMEKSLLERIFLVVVIQLSGVALFMMAILLGWFPMLNVLNS